MIQRLLFLLVLLSGNVLADYNNSEVEDFIHMIKKVYRNFFQKYNLNQGSKSISKGHLKKL